MGYHVPHGFDAMLEFGTQRLRYRSLQMGHEELSISASRCAEALWNMEREQAGYAPPTGSCYVLVIIFQLTMFRRALAVEINARQQGCNPSALQMQFVVWDINNCHHLVE